MYLSPSTCVWKSDQFSMPTDPKPIATYSNQLATDATAVLAFLQPTDWIIDDLEMTSQLCCVVPVVDKELAFE